MKMIIIKVSLFSLLFLISSCFFKPSQVPLIDGPAFIFKNDDAYYAIFPRTYHLFGNCGQYNPDSNHQIDIDKSLILKNEAAFRESYYKFLVVTAENLHPDSAAYIVEFPGEYALLRKVTHKELIINRLREYKTSIGWDREYLGFINNKKDTLLIVNLINPEEFSRKYLGYEWIFGTGALLKHIHTVAYNLSDKSITYDICDAIKNK